MRLLFVLAALAVPLASSPAHTPETERAAPTANLGTKPFGSNADCKRSDVYPVDQHGTPVPKRLDELPPGQLYLSVLREVDGCQTPVIVGRGYGFGAPAPEATPDYPPRPRARRW